MEKKSQKTIISELRAELKRETERANINAQKRNEAEKELALEKDRVNAAVHFHLGHIEIALRDIESNHPSRGTRDRVFDLATAIFELRTSHAQLETKATEQRMQIKWLRRIVERAAGLPLEVDDPTMPADLCD